MLLPRAVAAVQQLAIGRSSVKWLLTTSYDHVLDNHLFTIYRRTCFHSSTVLTFRGFKDLSLKPIYTNTLLHVIRSASSTSQSSTFDFEKDCEETLESLLERFEEILEGDLLDPKFTAADVSDLTLSSGVLNVYLGPERGTYVINKQSPNRQIWLSSPVSGPSRFDFSDEEQKWIYSRTGESLHELLNKEIAKKILKSGANAEFEKCFLGGSDNKEM